MYKYFVGDTRGWIEVKKEELGAANLLGFISTSSYEKNDYIYLDEDIDFSFFLDYLGDMPELTKIHVKDNYFDKYNRYRGGMQ